MTSIKAACGHGRWLGWVAKELNVDRESARRRMMVGSLPHLPKKLVNERFAPTLENLAFVGKLATKHDLTPEEAVQRSSDAARRSPPNAAVLRFRLRRPPRSVAPRSSQPRERGATP